MKCNYDRKENRLSRKEKLELERQIRENMIRKFPQLTGFYAATSSLQTKLLHDEEET